MNGVRIWGHHFNYRFNITILIQYGDRGHAHRRDTRGVHHGWFVVEVSL